MARYDYRCVACGTVFEVEHGMGEHPEVSCPACGSAVERVFNASGIVFAGHGFYNTDQRKEGGKPGSGASSASGKDAKDASKDAAPTHNEKAPGSTPSSASPATSSTE